MKRFFLSLIICTFAIFHTGCDEIKKAIASQSGCMLPDASNYNASALFACSDATSECLEGKTGNNCCCEDVTYGCTDATKYNYTSLATTACDNDSHGCGSENCCCTDVVSGCMNPAATNYNALANTDDDSCTFNGSTFGCTDPTGCNYISSATLDCNQIAIEGIAVADQNTNCCSSPSNTTCYYDGDNNGFVESTQTLSSAVCDCAELGLGWKNENQVSSEIDLEFAIIKSFERTSVDITICMIPDCEDGIEPDCACICGGDAIEETYYWDSDGDGLGAGEGDLQCNGSDLSNGWVSNDDDDDDTIARCYIFYTLNILEEDIEITNENLAFSYNEEDYSIDLSSCIEIWDASVVHKDKVTNIIQDTELKIISVIYNNMIMTFSYSSPNELMFSLP